MGTAKAVYIGDGKSNLFYGFYGKCKEICRKYQIPYDKIGSCKWTELQMRDEVAHEIAMLMSENLCDIRKLTFDLLASSLRFVNCNKNQQNSARWRMIRFVERFLGYVESLKLKADRQRIAYMKHKAV